MLFGGLDPVKKRGPWAVADLRVVTLSGDSEVTSVNVVEIVCS